MDTIAVPLSTDLRDALVGRLTPELGESRARREVARAAAGQRSAHVEQAITDLWSALEPTMVAAERDETENGLVIYDKIPTTYGHTITVQASSAASAAHAWLAISEGETTARNAHLNVEQASRLRAALTAFIAEAK